MAELYEKELARPGWYAADGGPTLLTPERLERWAKCFQDRRREGYGFPTPWGHKLTAVPTESDPYALDEQYARWNAGQMEWVERRPNGRAYLIGTVPPGFRINEKDGTLENPSTGTIVRYVSPGWGNWVDGQGREHQDELFHAALVTHPVQHDQEGFRRATITPPIPARADQRRFMSLAGRMTCLAMMAVPMGKNMPDDTDIKTKKKTKDDGKAAADVDSILDDETPAGGDLDGGATAITPDNLGEPLDPATPVTPEPAPAPAPAGDMGGNNFTPDKLEQLKSVMSQLGSPLLPDTSLANVVDRLITILHMAATHGATLVPSGGGAGGGQPLDLSMEGAQPDPMAPAAGGSGGMGMGFMSTKTGKIITLDPSGKALAEKAGADEIAKIGKAWDKLASGAPAAFKALCLLEKGLVSRFHMSLNPETGQVLCKAARARLNDMKRVLDALGHHKILGQMSRTLAQANPTKDVPPLKPSRQPPGHAPADDDMAKEIARLTPGAKPEHVRITRGQSSG